MRMGSKWPNDLDSDMDRWRSRGGHYDPAAEDRTPGWKPSPDYSWMRVWGMSGVDRIRALTRQYGYRRFPSRSSVEIHLWGER